VFPHEYRRALGERKAAAEASATIAKAKGGAKARTVPAK
jgi:hypothetical protein